MRSADEISALKAEINVLKSEVAELKEFIQAMYGMIADEDESAELFTGSMFGRFNT